MEKTSKLYDFFSKEENHKVYDKELFYQARLEERMQIGQTKGELKGRAEGKNEATINMATNMLKSNEPTEKIAKYTGLTIDKINKLKTTLF